MSTETFKKAKKFKFKPKQDHRYTSSSRNLLFEYWFLIVKFDQKFI